MDTSELDEDQHVVLWDVSWEKLETLLEIRGGSPRPRIFYLDGVVELMSPSHTHEWRNSTLARLLETWATETGVDIDAFGEWRLKNKRRRVAAQPDECYILGLRGKKRVPDLAIEVEWSRRVELEKHEIYRRLGVRELWTLRRDLSLVVHVLDRGAWVESGTSRLFPELDLNWLLGFIRIEPQSKAVRALLDDLRKRH